MVWVGREVVHAKPIASDTGQAAKQFSSMAWDLLLIIKLGTTRTAKTTSSTTC